MRETMSEIDLKKRESKLHSEILSIQDEIEMLLFTLKKREEELIYIQQQRAECFKNTT